MWQARAAVTGSLNTRSKPVAESEPSARQKRPTEGPEPWIVPTSRPYPIVRIMYIMLIREWWIRLKVRAGRLMWGLFSDVTRLIIVSPIALVN
jgi:hypothetical protein